MAEGEPIGTVKHEIALSADIGRKLRKVVEEKGEDGLNALLESQAENQKLKDEIARQNELLTKNGGAGTLSSSLNGDESGSHTTGVKEFEGKDMAEAYANMCDYLRAQSDPKSKAQLQELLQKEIMAQKANPRTWEMKDPWLNGESIVRKQLNKQNKRGQ